MKYASLVNIDVGTLLQIAVEGGVWIFSGMTHLCHDNMSMLLTFHIRHSEVDERTGD